MSYKVHYLYATTMTANGHASLLTGKVPRVHGIYGNKIFDDEKRSSIEIIDGEYYPVLGAPDQHASPERLRVKTVGEMLKQQNPDLKVVSLAWKNRAAVLMAGKKADFVAWFEKGAHPPRFTTSSYYAKHIPDWLVNWNLSHPVSAYMKVWNAQSPKLLERINGPDRRDCEDSRAHMGVTFPHDPNNASDLGEGLELTPFASEYVIDLARKTVQEFSLGTDDSVDLLQISISGTDVIGHAYGVESWEYFDNLIRVDRMLGELVDWLKSRTTVSLMITSDHGSIPFSKQKRAFVDQKALGASLDAHLDKKFGNADWVELVEHPYIYLDRKLQAKYDWNAVLNESVSFLNEVPQIDSAYNLNELTKRPIPEMEPSRSIWLGTIDSSRVDLYFIPGAYVIPSKSDASTHGTAWDYDREVPLLIWETTAARSSNPMSFNESHVASELRRLLSIVESD
ncbi:MAG: alkaline phosphatase family protein [Myxococcales bacterium]|nr:MAG: alkaline phosphatase family protein [Myxococcales bacterium]